MQVHIPLFWLHKKVNFFTQILCIWWCVLYTMTIFLKLNFKKSQNIALFTVSQYIAIYCIVTPVSWYVSYRQILARIHSPNYYTLFYSVSLPMATVTTQNSHTFKVRLKKIQTFMHLNSTAFMKMNVTKKHLDLSEIQAELCKIPTLSWAAYTIGESLCFGYHTI